MQACVSEYATAYIMSFMHRPRILIKLHNWVYIIIMLRLIAFSTDSTLMSRTTLRVLIRLENNSTVFQVLSFLLLILAVTYTRLVTLQLRNSQSSAAFFPNPN